MAPLKKKLKGNKRLNVIQNENNNPNEGGNVNGKSKNDKKRVCAKLCI